MEDERVDTISTHRGTAAQATWRAIALCVDTLLLLSLSLLPLVVLLLLLCLLPASCNIF